MLVLFLALELALYSGISIAKQESLIVLGQVEGIVSGAAVDYVRSLIDYGLARNADIIIIKINTPGGSLESTLEIIEYMRNSPIPIAVFVVDRWAVSAGTMILVCSDVAAMEPGTIIGAVQPVEMAGEGFRVINESKILNPIYKQMEACLKIHGRNYSIARDFVYKNVVLLADEAKELGVIDVVANSVHELISKINNTFIERLSKKLIIDKQYVIETYTMPLGLRLAQLLSDPIIGSLLSSIAILLILLGLASGHPSMLVPGIALLILSLFGLGFSASIVAIGLLLVGIMLIIIEIALIPGFGVVGLTGILLSFLGFIIAFSGKEMFISQEVIEAAFKTVLAVFIPLALFMGIIVYKAAKAWRARPTYTPEIIGKTGKAIDEIRPGEQGFVLVEGEYWLAKNIGRTTIHAGDSIRVLDKKGTLLLVERVEEL